MGRPVVTPGRLVAGRYRLLSQIGGGGMGTVWRAQDERLGRQVAVKQILPPAGADPHEAEAMRQRALREGRIAARLSNPHSVSIYDVAVEDGEPWLVMEYLPSRSLATVLEQDGVLRADLVAQIGAQVADALAATHTAGIVHRDVKPANVLIGQGERVDGLVKITDFGISHASGDVTLTRTGQITGTPAFLAPEVARGEDPGPASDVFSLGATLYTCLEGEPPFGMGDNALQQLHRVAAGEIAPPQRSGSLTQPLLRMLSPDPAQRPTMAEVRDELARLAAGRDGDTTTVLLARTDLHSGPRGTQAMAAPQRTRTDLPAAVGGWAPAPGGTDRRTDRRRRPGMWLLAGALVALLAIGGLVLASATSGNDGTSAQRTSSASGPPPSARSGAASSAPATSAASTPAAPPASVRAKDVRDFLNRYHDLLPGSPEQAWALTGPTLRGTISEQDYVAFWQQFDSVKLSGVQAQDGSLVATGKLEYKYRDGRKVTEQHQFTLVPGSGGQLLMDSDRKIG